MKEFIVFVPNTFTPEQQRTLWPNASIYTVWKQPSANHKVALISAAHDDWLTLIQESLKHSLKVLVLSNTGTLSELQQALNAGAKGYVEPTSDIETLHMAAQSIQRNALWIPSQFLNKLVGLLNSVLPASTEHDPFSILTAKERQVAESVCQGQSNREIAEALSISERTVKMHLTSCFNKLGVKDRLQLVLLTRQ